MNFLIGLVDIFDLGVCLYTSYTFSVHLDFTSVLFRFVSYRYVSIRFDSIRLCDLFTSLAKNGVHFVI